MHGPVCPCCAVGRAGGGSGALAGVLEMVLCAVWAVAVVAARFVSGRVLHREVGPWDARWRTWAPEPPDYVWAMRGVRPPRSRWARRPGLHRQAVRLAAVAVLAGLLLAPLMTVVALAGAGVATAVAAIQARRRPVPTPAPAPGPAYVTGREDDPAALYGWGRAYGGQVYGPTEVRNDSGPVYVVMTSEWPPEPLRVTSVRADARTRWEGSR